MPGHRVKKPKIKIVPYKNLPKLPPDYYETTSQLLVQGILEICQSSGSKSNQNLQHLYQQCVNLLNHSLGRRLYGDVVQALQTSVQTVLSPLSSQQPVRLDGVVRLYHEWLDCLIVSGHILSALDRVWYWNFTSQSAVLQSSTTPDSDTRNWFGVGLYLFQQQLTKLNLLETIYDMWKSELLHDWEEPLSDRSNLRNIWYLWHDLGLLKTLPLQKDLEWHWTQISERYKSQYDLEAFLDYCYAKHMHTSCWRPWLPVVWLRQILDSHLVGPHFTVDFILNPQYLHPLLQKLLDCKPPPGKPSSFVQMFELSSRLPDGTTRFKKAIQQFAKQYGLQQTNVPDLLKFQSKLAKLVTSIPEVVPLKKVWEDVVNVDTNEVSFAEQLAKFLDSILRSNKKLELYNLETIIDGVFVPLSSKDVFEKFFRKDTAKRLLWNRIVSMDIEKQVCSLLKAECGNAYTAKMEGMFQDVENSRETMMVYKQSAVPSTIDVEVQVLTTGYWPVYPVFANLNIPNDLKEPQERFADHYRQKYQGRRMAWQYALGHCIVKANGFTKPYELLVSLCQALVLVQFDADSCFTLPQLQHAIGMEDRSEMERILQSLSLGKDGTRILKKTDFDTKPKTRMSVDDKDTFRINDAFTSNARRIRITNIMIKESREERTKTLDSVVRDRLYTIDAVLVRILKARKTILHQALIPQVLEQAKFPAQPSDVKKRIESLIEREYMERDSKDRNRYNYLA